MARGFGTSGSPAVRPRRGRHETTLDGAVLPSGVGLVRLATGGAVHTERVTLAQ
ncbi:MAG: hypothetical protein AAGI91_00620 [Bacteroidota bacterium]